MSEVVEISRDFSEELTLFDKLSANVASISAILGKQFGHNFVAEIV